MARRTMSAPEGHQGGDDFRTRLQSWRHQRRLTQEQLGDQLGYEVSYIRKIEGGSRPPSRAFMARLSLVAGPSAGLLEGATVGDVGRPTLPQAPDRLIGRHVAVDAVVALLTGTARCVTLVGPPGIGKTRLAMAVAARLEQVFPDGAWWVPLLDVDRAAHSRFQTPAPTRPLRRCARVRRSNFSSPAPGWLVRRSP
jgi:transcriptional regulator with XRE-family HTH domain